MRILTWDLKIGDKVSIDLSTGKSIVVEIIQGPYEILSLFLKWKSIIDGKHCTGIAMFNEDAQIWVGGIHRNEDRNMEFKDG